MSGVGTGYDLSCMTFSPDGKVFQVEYAVKAVENSGTTVGIRCKDGVVLGVEKLVLSKMLEPGSSKRVSTVDRHIGFSFAGLTADGRALLNRARSEAKNYKNFYRGPVPGRILCERLAGFMQVYTLYGHVRPFGCSVLLATYDADGPHLYMIEPSGLSYGYYGAAAGKARQAAKGELDKLKFNEMTCREAVKEVARIIHTVHDDVKDKEFELELSWICAESKFEHQLVPTEVHQEAEKYAKSSLEDMEEDQ